MPASSKTKSILTKTPSFIYIKFIVALYCIAIIFLAGIEPGNEGNEGFYQAAALLTCSTTAFLVLGWFVDFKFDLSYVVVKKMNGRRSGRNWFKPIIYIGMFLLLASVTLFHFPAPLDIPGPRSHLIVATVVLPMLSFVMYLLIIRRRARKARIALDPQMDGFFLLSSGVFAEIDFVAKACGRYDDDDDTENYILKPNTPQ